MVAGDSKFKTIFPAVFSKTDFKGGLPLVQLVFKEGGGNHLYRGEGNISIGGRKTSL